MKPIMLWLLLLSILFTSCNTVKETPTPTVEPSLTPQQPAPTPAAEGPVTFDTEDGITLAGTLFGSGETAVILAHMGMAGADQESWFDFAQLLADRGYTALAFDFRGVGKSGGSSDHQYLVVDVAAAQKFLQDQGHHTIICIGASMGGTACLRLAIDQGGVEGVVALSSTMVTDNGVGGISVEGSELSQLTIPKLFITADQDFEVVVNDTNSMYESSAEPKEILILPGFYHGTDMFYALAKDDLTNALLDFVDRLAADD